MPEQLWPESKDLGETATFIPSFLIRAKISFPIKGQHALETNPEPQNYISSSSWICSFFLQYLE